MKQKKLAGGAAEIEVVREDRERLIQEGYSFVTGYDNERTGTMLCGWWIKETKRKLTEDEKKKGFTLDMIISEEEEIGWTPGID